MSQQQQQQKRSPAPPQPTNNGTAGAAATRSAKESEDAKRQKEELEERRRVEMEAEAKAAAAHVEARKAKKEAHELAARVREAKDALQAVADSARRRAAHRRALQPAALEDTRRAFDATKKSLKTDLKKCTAFVKKVKSGSMWTTKPDDVLRDVTTLNLSRYVEEVANGVMESKPKITDLPAVVGLCVSMHERYPDFLPALLPIVLEAVQGRGGDADAAKAKRLYLRVLTEFLLAGLVTDPKPLLKCVAEATGASAAKDSGSSGGQDDSSSQYTVQDGNSVVAFCKAAAGYEVFGIAPRSIRKYADFLRSEKDRIDQGTSPLVQSTILADAGVDVVTQGYSLALELETLAGERAVTADVAEALTKHCRGAYRFLATSLVQTHKKLKVLEKRCEQDRLMSGTLTDAREKGLGDARNLKSNLLKSVESLSDILDEEAPILIDEDDSAGGNAGAGVEVWTKRGTGEEDDLGPFDDEETRDFYFDLPDLLATIPPALLGLSPEQIQKRKEENLIKYGKFGESAGDVVDDSQEVTPATEAELDATESDQNLDDAMGDDENGEDGGMFLVLGTRVFSSCRILNLPSFHKMTRVLPVTSWWHF
jgi:regulator of nonsense transcripts 2